MTIIQPLQLSDIQHLCTTNTEETLTLEFKSCNELRIGSTFYKKSVKSQRSKDEIVDELSRDVSAFLNSAGGSIIYGIKEKNSRAQNIDQDNAYESGENITPEVIVQWIRAYIQPSPTINVYRVFEEVDNPSSNWYLVIEIPQGQQAYMAKDHRFYKRVSNIVQPMEQYEVNDVMNRTRGALLVLQMSSLSPQVSPKSGQVKVGLQIAITSNNFIASEHGALKLTIGWPASFTDNTEHVFGSHSQFDRKTKLPLEGYSDIPAAESVFIRWGLIQAILSFLETGTTFIIIL